MFGRRASGPPKEAVYDFDIIPPLAPSPEYVFSALVQHTTTCTLYTDLRQWALTRAHGSQPGPKIHLAFQIPIFTITNPLRRERFQSSCPIGSHTLHPFPPHTTHPASHSCPA
ncbi:hypothetical protein BDV93DRAFT_189939 [Ceratobasidium sp. AG-I]|nr:hypothetical protein BDV93DRAFT_189939 [Ceratobasidium sp. AG-I]